MKDEDGYFYIDEQGKKCRNEEEEEKTIINIDDRISDDLYIIVHALIEHGSIGNNWEEISHVLEKPHRYKLELESLGFEVKS